MSRRLLVCLASAVLLVRAEEGRAQGGGTAIYGVVRDADRHPLEGVVITVASQKRRVATDSAGRYSLDSLRPGSVQVIARAIGMGRTDTTLALQAGTRTRWDVVMREPPDAAEFRKQDAAAEAENVKTGKLDSVGLGLIKPDQAQALRDGGFGRRLFADAVVRRGADSNTILSPLSAVLALSIARLGARGATASALDQLLGSTTGNRYPITTHGPEILAALNGRTDVTLEVANAIWVDSKVTVSPPFRSAAATWRAVVSSLALASPAALTPINHWADSVTHGKITSILADPLPDTTRLFIANAVYFKGKWLDPFAKSATKPGPFTLASGERATVPRMDRVGTMAYRRLASSRVVRVPYRTGKVAMYVILPDSGASIDAVMRDLDESAAVAPPSRADWKNVHLVLPRFHAELGVDLVPALKAMGAGIALDCDRADFSGIARSASGDVVPLCIGKAFQRIYIDVDEEGTEAAAITGLGMVGVTSTPPPPVEFIVDRPFLFVLRDEMTGADLFIGRVNRP